MAIKLLLTTTSWVYNEVGYAVCHKLFFLGLSRRRRRRSRWLWPCEKKAVRLFLWLLTVTLAWLAFLSCRRDTTTDGDEDGWWKCWLAYWLADSSVVVVVEFCIYSDALFLSKNKTEHGRCQCWGYLFSLWLWFGLTLTLAYTVIVVVSLLVRPEEEQRQGIAKETAAASRHRAGSTNAQLFVNPADFGFLWEQEYLLSSISSYCHASDCRCAGIGDIAYSNTWIHVLVHLYLEDRGSVRAI